MTYIDNINIIIMLMILFELYKDTRRDSKYLLAYLLFFLLDKLGLFWDGIILTELITGAWYLSNLKRSILLGKHIKEKVVLEVDDD